MRNITLLLTVMIFSTISVEVNANEIPLNLGMPKTSASLVEINVNKNKINEELIKLITLEGMSSTKNPENIVANKNSFKEYFLSGDEKFTQANITSAYSDYTKAVVSSNDNDFQSLLLAYKLANIGFFTLSQHAINQIEDAALYSPQAKSIKKIFFPEVTLTYDEEILLAELYADIYYNNLAQEAVKEINKHHNLLKKSDYANYIMAQAYFESGKYGKALNSVNKALNIKKNSPFYLQYKAKILCQTKNSKEALKILEKIKSTDIAIERFIDGIKAQTEFTLANEYKDVSKSKYHLAKYFLLIGEYNRALKEANNSISVKKRNYEAYTLIGDIQLNLGDFVKAKEAYNKAVLINKKYAPAIKGLGNIAKMTGTYEDALKYYTQAQKYAKTDIAIAINIAQIQNLLGKTETAKEICSNLLLKNQNSSDLYYIMSEIYTENKQDYLRKALSLNAFNSSAWIDMAEINISENIELAEKYLMSVKISGAENYKYYYVEGLLNKQNGNISAAIISFKNSLKLNPNYNPSQKELNTLNL